MVKLNNDINHATGLNGTASKIVKMNAKNIPTTNETNANDNVIAVAVVSGKIYPSIEGSNNSILCAKKSDIKKP